MRVCPSCKVTKDESAYYRASNKIRRCRTCQNKANTICERRKLYGITPEQFEKLFNEQNGVCAICGGTNPEGGLCVDHNHQTGQIRQLLCRSCNLMIGNAHERSDLLTKAAAYLITHSER